MKLINRETGNNCYEIIKEYKGGLTARFYQTVAFFFDGDLKQPYDPNGDDAEYGKDCERSGKDVWIQELVSRVKNWELIPLSIHNFANET